jgi:hypothetical protein
MRLDPSVDERDIRASLSVEGVPFVGNDACAHNLLLKGRPLIMRLPSTTRLKTHSRSRFCLNELRLVGREKQIARQSLVDLCLSPPCLH